MPISVLVIDVITYLRRPKRITKMETIKRQTRVTYGCLSTGQSPWPRAWAAA